MKQTRFKAAILFILLIAALYGCAAAKTSAPIVDRYTPAEKPPTHYVVLERDTLFSIAWRYGFDMDRLATANALSRPYTLFPGQTLILQESSQPLLRRPPSNSKAKTRSQVAAVVKRKAAKTPQRQSIEQANQENYVAGPWLWPHHGPVVRPFVAYGQAHKGVDIKGKIGEPVKASRSGVVVYSGSGLVGYGKLLIIKHAAGYLSAYGHNRRLLKKEGEEVAAGERIAELGDTGTDTPKLHFEIRNNGKPVNPLSLLKPR